MAVDAGITTFVTGATKLMGAELVRVLLALGHRAGAAARLVLGPALAEYLQGDAVFSNIRLRGIGFRFRYPTLEQGLDQVLGALHE